MEKTKIIFGIIIFTIGCVKINQLFNDHKNTMRIERAKTQKAREELKAAQESWKKTSAEVESAKEYYKAHPEVKNYFCD